MSTSREVIGFSHGDGNAGKGFPHNLTVRAADGTLATTISASPIEPTMYISPILFDNHWEYFKFPGVDYLLKYTDEPNRHPWTKKSIRTKGVEKDNIFDVEKHINSILGENNKLVYAKGIIFTMGADKSNWYWDHDLIKPFSICDNIFITSHKRTDVVITSSKR